MADIHALYVSTWPNLFISTKYHQNSSKGKGVYMPCIKIYMYELNHQKEDN